MSDLHDKALDAANTAYWHEVHNGEGYGPKCLESAINAYAEAGRTILVPIDDLLFAYRGLLVLRTMLRRLKLDGGVSATDEVLTRLQDVAPMLVPLTSFREVQP
jgi:hypothetical protein